MPSSRRRVSFAYVGVLEGRAVALRNALKGVLVPRPFGVPFRVR